MLPLKHGFCSHCQGLRPCYYCQRAADADEPAAKVWYPQAEVTLIRDPEMSYIYMCPAHHVIFVEELWPCLMGFLEDCDHPVDVLLEVVTTVLLERGEELDTDDSGDYKIQDIDLRINDDLSINEGAEPITTESVLEQASTQSLRYLRHTLKGQLELAESEPVGRPRIYCNNCQARIVDAEARCFAVANLDPNLRPAAPKNILRRQLGYRNPHVVWSWNSLQSSEPVLHNFLIFEEDIFICDRCDDDPLTDDAKKRPAKPELYNPEWDADDVFDWYPA